MGIFSALLGNAGAVSRDELKKQYEKLLIEGEIIELGFKLIRDTFIFTNKRLILIDKQGITGSKVDTNRSPIKVLPDSVWRQLAHLNWMPN